MADEETASDTAPEEPTTPEVGEVAPDPSMEVAAGERPEVVDAEVGTDMETGEAPADPEKTPPESPLETAEAEDEDEDDDDDDEESSPVEDQANYEPPPGLDQASYVQGLMVAGSNQGQDQRRESLVRNRERRRLQHEAIRRSNQG